MPANSAQYQKEHRDKTKDTRKVVSVSMSVSEHERLRRYARSHKLSLSSLLRASALAQCEKSQLTSPEVQAELRELKFLLSNVANNMNQMAYHSNLLRQVQDENGVLQAFAEMESLLHNFVSQRMTSP